ncbi:hypothetical protein HDU67_009026 [Dinochytrium kinnereticum]|nr:hypothetical protein HDU67_009026 [Dinochytrium kinnereticum]
MLIALEGIDRSGKSTQCQMLKESICSILNNPNAAEIRRFPGRAASTPPKTLTSSIHADRSTKTGAIIDEYLKSKADVDDRTIHMLFAVNRSEAMASLEKTLKSGKSVIMDRYAYSGVAYTMAKQSNHLSWAWCKSVDSGILKPDIVLFLDTSVNLTSSRGQFGEERYETEVFQEKVRKTFMKLRDDTWKVYDASMDKEALASRILEDVKDVMAKKQNTPLDLLWPALD